MAHYIDGFVFPIPRDHLNEYARLAESVAEIWKEHGALDYCEYAGDDMKMEGTRSFTELVAATNDETIVFGWVVFDSREARDLIHRIQALMLNGWRTVGSSHSFERRKRMPDNNSLEPTAGLSW